MQDLGVGAKADSPVTAWDYRNNHSTAHSKQSGEMPLRALSYKRGSDSTTASSVNDSAIVSMCLAKF